MSIVSSAYTIDSHAQADGSRYVVERHEDSAGTVHQFLYRAPAGFNSDARLAARAVELAALLADLEVDAVTANG